MCRIFFIFLCFILFSVFPLFAGQTNNLVTAAEPYGIDFSQLQGSVQQVTEYRGEKIDKLVKYSVQEFSDNKILNSTVFDQTGNVRAVTKYDYDSAGKLLSITGTDSAGSVKWSYQYSYNESGLQTEEKSYNSANVLEGRITFRYDKNGRMLEQRTYNGSGELTLKRTLVYNELGQVSSDSSQYADDKLLKRMIFTYTKKGSVLQEDHFDATGFYERIDYSYGDTGRLSGFVNIGKGSVINSRTELTYGATGKIAREKITNGDNIQNDIVYTYDYNENWIVKFDGKSYTFREIAYKG